MLRLHTIGQIAAGIAMLLSNAKAIRVNDEKFLAFGNAKIIFDIPLILVFALIFVLIAYYLLHKTPFGIKIYGLGNNEILLKQVGINTVRLKIIVYSLSCLYAGLGGALLMARLGAGSPVQGENYTLLCIAASVIGGVNMAGGYGKILNTVVGSIVISMLNNILNLLQINNNVQEVVLGVVIITLVGVSSYIRNRNEKLLMKY